MIKIERADCPPVLQNASSEGKHYNKKEVVKVLWEMQKEKCCYCEQKIPQEGHLKAVEHFKPKSIFKNLTNDWKNLLLSCSQCNGKKSNKFPVELTDELDEPKVVYLKRNSDGNSLIIDPSDKDIDPEKYIDFVVDDIDDDTYGLIKEKDNRQLGHITIKAIGLESYYYTKKRRDMYLNVLIPTFNTLLSAKSNGFDQIFEEKKDFFRMWMSAKGEFAAFARAFARYRKFDSRFGIDIPVGAAT